MAADVVLERPEGTTGLSQIGVRVFVVTRPFGGGPRGGGYLAIATFRLSRGGVSTADPCGVTQNGDSPFFNHPVLETPVEDCTTAKKSSGER